MRHSFGKLATMLLCLGLPFAPAQAKDVVRGVGQVHTVTRPHEVLKGTFAGVIVEADGAHVVLSQATIDCANAPWPQVGLHLPSGRSDVRVNGGTVQNCNIGVLIGDPLVWGDPAGQRNHIHGLTVRNSAVTGGTHFDGDGIAINRGIGNRVVGSVVEGSSSMGVRVFQGSGNFILGNTIRETHSPSNDPNVAALILQSAVGTAVRNNTIADNGSRGIWAQFNASRNVLTGNHVLDNGTDIVEDTSPCANRWRDNAFETLSEASAGCVQ